MRRRTFLTALGTVALAPLTVLAGERPADPHYRLQFPRDHGAHPDFATEWWYYTGHLFVEGSSPFVSLPDYGFQLTFFRRAASPSAPEAPWGQAYLAHSALTEVPADRFLSSHRFARGGLGIAGAEVGRLEVWNHEWRVAHLGDGHLLDFRVDEGRGVRLLARPEGAPVLHGALGYSKKGSCSSCASHYYSFPGMRVEGDVTVGSQVTKVTGLAWMDHEFMSHSLSADQVGWDWFSIMTAAGDRIMVYSLRGTTPSAGYLSGTIVRNGTSSTLTSDDVTIEVLQRWRSQKTGTEYPARWRVSVPSIGYSAVLTPLVAHQEMVGVDGATPTYWEGAAVSEDRRSLAYVELTGYGTPLNKLL